MGKCASCGSVILFGGKQQANRRYCNDRCMKRALLIEAASELPDHLVLPQVQLVHQGLCPKCQGTGPIDVHVGHRVWSALFITSWVSRPQVCCRSCGTRTQALDALFCLALGWWGFPWGLLMTPVQIVRNVMGMAKGPDPTQPSAALTQAVRIQMAEQFLHARQHRAA